MDKESEASSIAADEAAYERLVEDIASTIKESLWIWDQAYDLYQPLVEQACREDLPCGEVEHLLDGLLNFAGMEANMEQFRRVCRRYWRLYPGLVADYVYLYRDLYDSDEEGVEE